MKPCIVYIDDLESDRYHVQRFLSGVDVEVHAFGDMESASHYLRTAKVAVVLVDLNLGVTHGVETVREAVRRFVGVPVIAVTGDISLYDYHEDLRAAGAKRWMAKSGWNTHVIMRHIRAALDHGGPAYA